jgi:hypothetical protein
MIRATATAGPAKEADVVVSAVDATVGEGATAADVDVATSAKHTLTKSSLVIPTGISLRTNGSASDPCAHMSCSCEMAVVVTEDEATRVTKQAMQIDPPAVYLQLIRALTTPLTRLM